MLASKQQTDPQGRGNGLDQGSIPTVLVSTCSLNVAPNAMAADWDRGDSCRRDNSLQIQDLDMSPNPIVEGQRVRVWKVRMSFEGRRECEGNKLLATRVTTDCAPDINEIEIPVGDAFGFKGRESCFNVQVDLEGSCQPDRFQPALLRPSAYRLVHARA